VERALENVLTAGTGALDALGLKYAVVGGLAVSAWAQPRTTRDVDLYAEMPISRRSELRAELENREFAVPAMDEELRQFGVFRSRHGASGVFLDIFDAVGPLGASILERRQLLSVGSRDLWLISPEDLALLKAFSDRPRDFEDLVALCGHLKDRLDQKYIDVWVQALDSSIGTSEVSERMQAARLRAARPSR
jgi:hypothetical protein